MPKKELAASKAVVILGSASSTARYIAHEFARAGYDLVLGDFDHWENDRIAADVRVRFDVQTYSIKFNALAFETHAKFVEDCTRELGAEPEGVILCFGFMAQQADAQKDFVLARRTIDTNLSGAVSILEQFASLFEARKHGFIAALSSVAGDRGRQANYIYGASKGGFSVYLEGLRNRLHAAGVQVCTIKPGFMDTKMTYGMDLPGPLVASPQQAARAIYRAIQKKKNTAYIFPLWRYIMLIIRHIPEWQFKKMNV
jgi:decaprenylphospho-beta-D-erythro-pentofuranosid-2-ulose 2-reductase